MVNEEVTMTMSVLPGAMTGISTLMAGMVSINNVFMDMTRQIDSTFGLVDATVITAGTVVAQFGLKAAEAFGEFEQGMKIVQMVSGQTRSDIEQLSQVANQFSVQYRMDIDQITEGLQTLGRAGLNSASEQTEVLKNGLNTSKLEGRELNSVLEELIQNTALLGGDLKSSNFGSDSQYVNDLLVATSMTAPITTHDVSETLKYSGGIAAAAGAHIRDDEGNSDEKGKEILEDYMGAIAAFAQKGVTGSIAGTALRAFFNKPATQDSSVTEALSSIHLKPEYLWEDDEETMKPISEQIGIIEKQMEKLNVSTMDRLQIWSKIVGGKMGQQMMKLHSDDIKELTNDIQKAEDATSLAAGAMQTYQANMKQMSEQGQVAFREFGGHVAQFLNPVISLITQFLGLLSNPYASGALFAGFLAIMTKVYSTIKKVLGGLKAEFSQFMSFFKSGESLFAIRPSLERSLKRKGEYTDYSKATVPKEVTTVDGLVKAFKNQASEDRLKYLRTQYGLSDAEIGALGVTKSWTKSTLVDGMGDNEVLKSFIKSHSLSEEMLNDIFILNKDEWIEKHVKNLQPKIDELGKAAKEAAEKIKDLGNKSAENKNTSREQKMLDDFEAELDDKYNLNSENKKSSTNAYGRPIPGYIPNEALEFLNKENEERNSSRGSSLKGGIPYYKFVDMTGGLSDVATGDPDSYLYTHFSPFGYTGGELVDDKLKGFKDVKNLPKSAFTESFFNNKNYKFNLGFTPVDYLNSIPDISELNGAKEFADFYAKNASDLFTFRDRTTNAKFQLPISRIIEDYMSYSVPNIGKEEFGNFDAGGGKKIKEIFKGKEFDAMYIRFNKMVEDGLRQYMGYMADQIPVIPENEVKNKTKDVKYPTLEELQNDRLGKIMTKKELERVLSEKGISYDSKMTKGQLAELAGGHVLDWEKMDWNDFRTFAKGEGVSAKGSRADIIARLNEKYANELSPIAKNWLDDYDSVADNVAFRDAASKVMGTGPSGQVEGNNLQASAEDFRKAAAEQVKAARMQREAAEKMRTKSTPGTGGDTTYKYGEDFDEQRELNKRKKQLEEYSDMATSSPDQVHNTSRDRSYVAPKEANYIGVGKGALPNRDEELVLIDGKWAIVPSKAEDIRKGPKYDVVHDRNMSVKEEYKAWGLEQSFKEKMKDSELFKGLKNKLGWSSTAGTLRNLGTAASSVADIFGGPLVLGMMAFETVITKVQEAFQEYCSELKDAQDQLKDAYGERTSAENSLKSAYKEQNPDSSDEEIEGMVYESYGKMQEDMKDRNKWMEKVAENTEAKRKQYAYDEEKDDGSYKEEKEELDDDEKLQKSIDENTSALYTATAEINVALNKLVAKMDDHTWGIDGTVSKLSDKFGYMSDTWLGAEEGSSFSDSGNYLMTASQKDSNYAGYTEFAGLFLEDAFDKNGSLQGTVDTLFGADADRYMGALNKGTKEFLTNMARFSRSLGRGSNSRLQASMMNDKKSWQGLAKEVAKYESKNKKSVGAQDTKNTRMENLIKKLQIDTGLNRMQVLQAAYLQQMQDMYAIAEQVMVPLIAQNATAAANTMMLGQAEFPYNQGTTNYTYGTMQIAQAISAQLATIAWAKAGEATRNAALADPNNPLHELAMNTDDGNQFMKEAIKQEEGADIGGIFRGIGQVGEFVLNTDNGMFGGKSLSKVLFGKNTDELAEEHGFTPLSKQHWYVGGGNKTAMDQILDTFGATTYTGLGMSMNDAIKAAQEDRKKLRDSGENYSGIYDYFAKMWGSEQMAEQVFDSYMASGLGEADEGSGGGGGSGSGSGNNGNNNQGTRKERVDLVLCNKKEIPKLNVNLFKKPPTFTVLNKNFKVRDVKINTEDTPKSIMSAIKNSFIDVQKRSDPKIIQDEEGVYNPEEATDGNPLPSGSAKTKTD